VLGAEPGPAAGVSLALGLTRERLAFGMELRVDMPREQALSGAAIGSIDAAARVLAASACFVPGWLRACALGGLAVLQAEGQGLPSTRSGVGVQGLLGLRLGAELSLAERFFLRTDLDAYAALGRVAFRLAGRQVWETSTFQGALVLSLGASL
jgi:hypothetical protein